MALANVTPPRPKNQKHDSHNSQTPASPAHHLMQSGVDKWSQAKRSTTFGRAPWYGGTRHRPIKETFLIGVAGGTASGKTSVCKAVIQQLNIPWVQILSLDCFYKVLSKEEIELANKEQYNFDHPDAFDWVLLERVLKDIKQGLAVRIPIYDFNTHSRRKESTLMYGADVVLCEGILTLFNKNILNQFDVKVFVNTDDDIRLIRRIRRDQKERGRSIDSILDQYEKTVKPSYENFCLPTQIHADIIIPRGRDNHVAIRLLVDHIRNKLTERGVIRANMYSSNANVTKELPSNVAQFVRKKLRQSNESSSDNIISDDNESNTMIELCEPSNVMQSIDDNDKNENNKANNINSDNKNDHKDMKLGAMIDKLFDKNCQGFELLQIVDTLTRELTTLVRNQIEMTQEANVFGDNNGKNGKNDKSNGKNDKTQVKLQLNFEEKECKDDGSKKEKKKKRKGRTLICAATIIRGGLIFENGIKLAFGDSELTQNAEQIMILEGTVGDKSPSDVKAAAAHAAQAAQAAHATTVIADNNENKNNENNENNDNGSDAGTENSEELKHSQMANIGKTYVLVHGNLHITHEQNNPELPRFFTCELPSNIKDANVIVFDALVGTGNRARMALQVLLDHHVPEEQIYFVCLVSSRSGISTLARFFPKTNFITAFIDKRLESSHWTRIEGISNLVVRYFGGVGIKMDQSNASLQTDIMT